MTDPTVTLHRADEDGRRYAEALLGDAGLPVDDLRTDPVDCYVARDGTDSVGTGALEVYDSIALLRSVAVEPDYRGRGYGAAIVDRLEEAARAAGVEQLYLLTTTASDFFTALDYEAVGRADAPAAVQNTTQFTDLCPSSATCLRKSL